MPDQTSELVAAGGSEIAKPKSYDDLFRLADAVTSTALCPAAYKGKPKDAAVAMMMAVEAGANPVTSLNFISVINGRPAWYADAVPGVAKNKGLITGYKEWFEGDPNSDDYKAVCEVYTPSGLSYRNEFSVRDAKEAKLHGKAGPWQQYKRRMMQWRARSWAIRDAAPDAFFGPTVEELQDENARYRGPENAKNITVSQDAPKRQIVTMTGSTDEKGEEAAQAEKAPKASVKVADQPKRSVKTIILMLADTESIDDIVEVESMLNENRDSMKPAHITALDRAIAEARARLMGDESRADIYAERIMAGGDFDAISSAIYGDATLSEGDRETLLGMIASHAGDDG